VSLVLLVAMFLATSNNGVTPAEYEFQAPAARESMVQETVGIQDMGISTNQVQVGICTSDELACQRLRSIDPRIVTHPARDESMHTILLHPTSVDIFHRSPHQ